MIKRLVQSISRFGNGVFSGAGSVYRSSGFSAYLKQWMPSWFGSNKFVNTELRTLRDRSRDLYNNTALGATIIDNLTVNTIGAGLDMISEPDADFLMTAIPGLKPEDIQRKKKEIESWWSIYVSGTDADIEGKRTYAELETLAYKTKLISGEVMALLPVVPRIGSPFRTRIQILEGDNIGSGFGVPANAPYGVETDSHGVPVAYWLAPGPGMKAERYPVYGERTWRRNVLHVYDQDRPGQQRGIPALTRIMGTLKNIDRHKESELVARLVQSYMTAVVKSPVADMLGAPASNKPEQSDIELGPGAVQYLTPGEELQLIDPNRNASDYRQFLDGEYRDIGMAMGIAYEELVLQFNSSYSASRMARMENYKRASIRRWAWAAAYHQPIFQEWLAEQVGMGRIELPGYTTSQLVRRAWAAARWVGDPPGSIDDLKEAQAAEKRLQIRLTTLEEEKLIFNGARNFESLRDIVNETSGQGATQPEPAPQMTLGELIGDTA
jgi:lambda family phage portal protein